MTKIVHVYKGQTTLEAQASQFPLPAIVSLDFTFPTFFPLFIPGSYLNFIFYPSLQTHSFCEHFLVDLASINLT